MAEILDGKALAVKILGTVKKELATIQKKLSLGVVLVGGDEVIKKFVAQKKKVADELGVDFRLYEYDAAISTNELRERLKTIVHDADPTGIIIQLPLPEKISTQYILSAVPSEKDVDVLSARALGNFFVGKSKILPPVVGAVKALLEEYAIDLRGKYVVLVGAGELVGKPLAAWLLNEKATFSVARSGTKDISKFTREADIIISGVGNPGLITGDMVKEGAIVIDAGTSESAGKLLGDVDFDSVSKKSSYITPVPGGVGPVTVAFIYKNLLTLARS